MSGLWVIGCVSLKGCFVLGFCLGSFRVCCGAVTSNSFLSLGLASRAGFWDFVILDR